MLKFRLPFLIALYAAPNMPVIMISLEAQQYKKNFIFILFLIVLYLSVVSVYPGLVERLMNNPLEKMWRK
jgi:hypothetical protein